jgi:WD40 repeat protein
LRDKGVFNLVIKGMIHLKKSVAFLLVTCHPVIAGVNEESEGIPIAVIERTEPVGFAKEIFPMLKANCIACHNATKAKGKLNLETPKTILKGGNEGPAVVPGKSAESLMLILASHRDEPTMPPEGNKSNAVPLTSEGLGLLKLWIDEGAKGEAASFVEAPEVWFPVMGPKQPVYNVAIAPEGRIAVAGRGNQIHLYDLGRGVLETRLEDPELAKEENFGTARAAHRDLVQSLAISPDGRVASGGFREVKLWSQPTQTLRHNLPGLPEAVTAVAASADGTRAIAGDSAGNVRTWELANPDGKQEAKVHDGPVTGAAFLGDSRIVTASGDGTLRIRAATGEPNEVKVVTPAPVNGLALVKGGSHLVTAHADNAIRLWAIPQGADAKPVRELTGHGKPVLCLAASPSNNSAIASGSEDNTARLWNLDDGSQIASVDHGVPVRAVAISPDGKRLVTAGGPTLKIWNLEDGAMLTEINGDGRTKQAVKASELEVAVAKKVAAERKKRFDEAAKKLKEEGDKSKAAGVSFAKAAADLGRKKSALDAAERAHGAAQITGNDEEKKKAQEAFNAAKGAVTKAEEAVARARQNAELGVRLTARSAEANIQAESHLAAADESVKEAEGILEAAKKAATEAAKPWNAVAFTADGLIIAGGESLEVTVWAQDGKSLHGYHGHRANITQLVTTSKGDVLSAAANKTLLHWDASPDWALERTLGDGKDPKQFIDRVTSMAFDPTGTLLATGGGSPSRSGELKVWNVADGTLLFSNDESHSDTIVGIEFSPDGRHIACASTDRFLRVFDAEEGKVVAAFEGHTGHVLDVAWRADGLVLASAGADKVIKLWDFEDRKQVKTEQGFGKEVTSVDFVGAGDVFLASSGDKTVRIGADKLSGLASYVHRSKTDAAGGLIVAGDQDGVFCVWQASDKKLLWTLGVPE